MQIRFVKAEEWGKVEGAVADMPWLAAKERFIAFFKEPRHGAGLYEHVEVKHGCYAANAVAWAIAMNSVITILNTLPDGATEADVKTAFGL
nr:hypothetical protein [uncultured Duganella sp.]